MNAAYTGAVAVKNCVRVAVPLCAVGYLQEVFKPENIKRKKKVILLQKGYKTILVQNI